MTDSMEDMLHIFIDEALELLETAELALLQLDENLDKDIDHYIADLFRSFHTIKGSAGLFDLKDIVSFTHVVENVLSRIRSGESQLTEDLLSVLLESRDKLALLVDMLNKGSIETDSELKQKQALIDKLQKYLADEENHSQSEKHNALTQTALNPVHNTNWHISLRFPSSALQDGMDPYSFVKYLQNLGEIVHVVLIADNIPELADLNPELCYLAFEISFKSDCSKEDIHSVFEFVSGDCLIHILPPKCDIDEYAQLLSAVPEALDSMKKWLLDCGALTKDELSTLKNAEQHLIENSELSADSTVQLPAEKTTANSPLAASKNDRIENTNKTQSKPKIDSSKSSVRVNAHKLEELIDLVGELVIGGANAELLSRKMGDINLIETMENMSRLVEEVRDTALGLRMVPIGDTFNRFKRVVREVSKNLEKQIELKISGEETELDKSLVEKIADPLMHLLRNAIDHGIEKPEVREAKGKTPVGTVWLDAFHDSGSIVIRVQDDGAGLNKEKIRDKAISKGLISESDNLSESEIFSLIFEPGFSTAAELTDLSGRGVGMDVVRRNIESFRGNVDVSSEAGKGTTFLITLPLTLAIIDGFQVSIGASHYIIPLSVVEECMELEYDEFSAGYDSHYINLRGTILPYIRLRDFFGLGGKAQGRENIVVVNYAGRRAGLVVDELHGEHQTVIKPLGVIFQNLRSISGATILGNGEVALIADVQNLIKTIVTSVKDDYLPHTLSSPMQQHLTLN